LNPGSVDEALPAFLIQFEPDAVRILDEADHVFGSDLDRPRHGRSCFQEAIHIPPNVLALESEVV